MVNTQVDSQYRLKIDSRRGEKGQFQDLPQDKRIPKKLKTRFYHKGHLHAHIADHQIKGQSYHKETHHHWNRRVVIKYQHPELHCQQHESNHTSNFVSNDLPNHKQGSFKESKSHEQLKTSKNKENYA